MLQHDSVNHQKNGCCTRNWSLKKDSCKAFFSLHIQEVTTCCQLKNFKQYPLLIFSLLVWLFGSIHVQSLVRFCYFSPKPFSWMIFLKKKTKTKTKLTACLVQVVEKDSVRKGCWLRAYFTFCSLFSWGSRLFSSAGELKKKKHHGLSSGSHCCSTRYSRAQVTNHILTEMFQLFIARLVQYNIVSYAAFSSLQHLLAVVYSLRSTSNLFLCLKWSCTRMADLAGGENHRGCEVSKAVKQFWTFSGL